MKQDLFAEEACFLLQRSDVMGKSAIWDVEIRPGIFVPAAVATFLVQRLQWIEGGEEGLFQVVEPAGFEFHDLCTLAFLLGKEQWGKAKEMVKNLPRPMQMDPSARLCEGNDNYLHKNPFRRRRRRRKTVEDGDKDSDKDSDKDDSCNLTQEDKDLSCSASPGKAVMVPDAEGPVYRDTSRGNKTILQIPREKSGPYYNWVCIGEHLTRD